MHISEENLTQLVKGELDSKVLEQIELHFASCNTCQTRAEQLSSSLANVAHDYGSDDDFSLEATEVVGRIQAELSTASSTTDFEKIGLKAESSNFKYIKHLPFGGFGELALFLDRSLGRQVVLKTLKSAVASMRMPATRFQREYRITSQLDHPSIPAVFGRGELEDGREYFALKYVDGHRLTSVIEQFHTENTSPTPRDFIPLVEMLIEICKATMHAHGRGIIHRDLKPDNVLIDRQNHVFVIDWGLARDRASQELDEADEVFFGGDELTLEGVVMGSLHYMAPEQARGDRENIDEKSDQYCIGSILFQILTNKPPHRRQSNSNERGILERATDRNLIMSRIGKGETPEKNGLDSAPAELRSICEKAMSFRRADRYESIQGLVDDLESWIYDRQISVHRYSVTEKISRTIRRYPIQMAGSFLLLLSLVAIASLMIALSNAAEKTRLSNQVTEEVRQSNTNVLSALKTIMTEDVFNDSRLRETRKKIITVLSDQLVSTDVSDPKTAIARANSLIDVAILCDEFGLNGGVGESSEKDLSNVSEPKSSTSLLLPKEYILSATKILYETQANAKNQNQPSVDVELSLLKADSVLLRFLAPEPNSTEAPKVFQRVMEKYKKIDLSRLTRTQAEEFAQIGHRCSTYLYFKRDRKCFSIAMEWKEFCDQLQSRFPESDVLMSEKALLLNRIGLSLHKGRSLPDQQKEFAPRKLEFYAASKKIYRRLIQRFPDEPKYALKLASVYSNEGMHLRFTYVNDSFNPEALIKHYDEGIAVLDNMDDIHKSTMKWLDLKGLILNNKADSLLGLGMYEEEALVREASHLCFLSLEKQYGKHQIPMERRELNQLRYCANQYRLGNEVRARELALDLSSWGDDILSHDPYSFLFYAQLLMNFGDEASKKAEIKDQLNEVLEEGLDPSKGGRMLLARYNLIWYDLNHSPLFHQYRSGPKKSLFEAARKFRKSNLDSINAGNKGINVVLKRRYSIEPKDLDE